MKCTHFRDPVWKGGLLGSPDREPVRISPLFEQAGAAMFFQDHHWEFHVQYFSFNSGGLGRLVGGTMPFSRR